MGVRRAGAAPRAAAAPPLRAAAFLLLSLAGSLLFILAGRAGAVARGSLASCAGLQRLMLLVPLDATSSAPHRRAPGPAAAAARPDGPLGGASGARGGPAGTRARPREANVVFVKTYKTGGTTLGSLLFRFGMRHNLTFFTLKSTSSHSMNARERPCDTCNISLYHTNDKHLGLRGVLPLEVYRRYVPLGQLVTIVREPRARFFSDYYFHFARKLGHLVMAGDVLKAIDNGTVTYTLARTLLPPAVSSSPRGGAAAAANGTGAGGGAANSSRAGSPAADSIGAVGAAFDTILGGDAATNSTRIGSTARNTAFRGNATPNTDPGGDTAPKTNFRGRSAAHDSAAAGAAALEAHGTRGVPSHVAASLDAFRLILVLERLDESLVLLKHVFGWQLVDLLYIPINRGCGSAHPAFPDYTVTCPLSAEQLPGGYRRKLDKLLAVDHIIYDESVRRLDALIARQDPVLFRSDVSRLRCMVRALAAHCSSERGAAASEVCNLYLTGDFPNGYEEYAYICASPRAPRARAPPLPCVAARNSLLSEDSEIFRHCNHV